MPGTVGRLLPGTEARVLDPDTGADLGARVEGELLIRGPQLMRGYRGQDDATAATIDADGWLHTGDLGAVSSDGVLRITDRLKELIKVNGFRIAPAELEGSPCAHRPSLTRCPPAAGLGLATTLLRAPTTSRAKSAPAR